MADPESVVPDEVAGDSAQDEPTSEEPSSQGDDVSQPAVLASELMKDPIMLAALQDKLGSMVGGSSGYIQSLPKPVKRRIKALKKIQFEATKIEAEFYREVHRLECEYANKYTPLCEKRGTIVMGNYEPNDDEADWPSDDEKDEELAKGTDDLASGDNKDEVKKTSLEEKTEENAENKDEKAEDAKGIPSFWLTIFKNVDMLSEMIQPHDEPILNHLQDIKVEFLEKDPMGFTLEFMFDENEYFDNKKLTKAYVMRSEPEADDPFSFEGPEIIKCNGCKIDWKKGKNVTVKTVKKKQKHKASGTTRTIQKTVQSDSFFNFFSPPSPPEDEMDEDTEALLAADFEIGHFIRERIVPRAVLYFTGEALENEDDDEYGEEEDGEEGDYDEDGDPDYSPGRRKFMSRAFQARCAQLALGRQSMPSSAPCDTRLMLRPSTGSAVRRDMTQSDLKSRPNTAPIRTPFNIIDQDTDSIMTRADVHSEAFALSDTNINRPKTVTFDKSGLNTKPMDSSLVRESTEIFLPNALQPEAVVEGDSKMAKLEREKTFISSKPSFKGKPPVPMSREKSLVQNAMSREKSLVQNAMSREKSLVQNVSTSNVDSGMKLQKKIISQHKDEHLDCVEEGSDDEADVAMVTDNVTTEQDNSKGKSGNTETSNKGLAQSKQAPSKIKPGTVIPPHRGPKSADPRRGVSETKNKSISQPPDETKGQKVTSAPQSSLKQPDSVVKNPQAHIRQQKISGAHHTKNREPSEKNKVKDAAFNILQKLTGKNRQSGHKAGSVPNVGKPKRRYRFSAPAESTDATDAQNVESAVDQEIPRSTGKEGDIPVVNHKYSYRGHGQFQVKPVYDSKGPHSKPASAPGGNSNQRTAHTWSAPRRNVDRRSGQTGSAPGRNAGHREGQAGSAPGPNTNQEPDINTTGPGRKAAQGSELTRSASFPRSGQTDIQSAGKGVHRNRHGSRRAGRDGNISGSLNQSQKLYLPTDDEFNMTAEINPSRSVSGNPNQRLDAKSAANPNQRREAKSAANPNQRLDANSTNPNQRQEAKSAANPNQRQDANSANPNQRQEAKSAVNPNQRPDANSANPNQRSHARSATNANQRPGRAERGKSIPVPTASDSSKSDGVSELAHTQEIQSENIPSASKRKGVRMINGMISTSVDESNTIASPDLDPASHSRGGTPGIHPKLQDSPYLKDNPLLQSGRHRRRHGGGSAHSGSTVGDGTE